MHRQALLRGLGLNDNSKTANSAMKEEELSQDEDEEIFGTQVARQFRNLAATLNK